MGEETKTRSSRMRALAVLLWTVGCAALWLLWVGQMFSVVDAQEYADPIAAIGCAACMVTGFVGGAWFSGLIVALVVLLIVRRS